MSKSLPAWLVEAKTYLRKHYPTDGLAESLLWALYVRGFELPEGDR